MERTIEQRVSIKFCVKLKKTATETLQMIQEAYGEDALSRTQVFQWHRNFREGRDDVHDKQRVGPPSTSHADTNVQKVRDVLNSDRRLSIRAIADEVGIDKMTVHNIIKNDLGMRKICAKLVPKHLTDEQKERRVAVASEILDRLQTEPEFFNHVITGDETWVFEYDPETKRQSSEWHTPASPRPKKARMSKSKVKSMLIAFFDVKGIVHKEFVPPGQTVNGQYYREVLRRLTARVRRVRPEIADSWILHHDNAPSHTCLLVTEQLAKQSRATLPQPPYSPDMAPADFFLFPKIKRHLKGTRFGTLENVQRATTRALDSIEVADFQGAFGDWKIRYQRVIDSNGDYFEDF